MPLVSIREEVCKAQAGGYAVPCFLAFDAVSAEGIFAAVAERSCPAIIGVYCSVLNSPGAEALVAYLLAFTTGGDKLYPARVDQCPFDVIDEGGYIDMLMGKISDFTNDNGRLMLIGTYKICDPRV